MAKPKLTPTPQWTEEKASHRVLAAAQAIEALLDSLESADTRLRAVEKDALATATKRYRSVIEEAGEQDLTPDDSHRILPLVIEGLATRQALAEAHQTARKNRGAERARVVSARGELLALKGGQAQISLPLEADTSGLGLFSEDVRAVTYTALVALDGRGALSQVMRELMVDLATVGAQPIAFVLDAGEALEEDVEVADVQVQAELAQLEQAANDLPI